MVDANCTGSAAADRRSFAAHTADGRRSHLARRASEPPGDAGLFQDRVGGVSALDGDRHRDFPAGTVGARPYLMAALAPLPHSCPSGLSKQAPDGLPVVLHAARAKAVVQERSTGCRTGAKEMQYSSSRRSGWLCLINSGAQSIRASMIPPKVSASRTRPGISSLVATRTPVSSQTTNSTLNEYAIRSIPFHKARNLEHGRPEGKDRIAHRSSSATPRVQLRRRSRTSESPAAASGHAPRSNIMSEPGRPQT